MNRSGFAGGFDFQIGWSNEEQNDEQVPPEVRLRAGRMVMDHEGASYLLRV